MQRKTLTILIYLSAAAAASCFLVSRHLLVGTWSAAFLFHLCFFAVPLLFVFSYPRFLFAVSPQQKNRQRSAAILHGLGVATTGLTFCSLALPFWNNPVRDTNSRALLLVPLIALPVFLVAALSLLLKNRSTLATFASFLLWPYWLLLALVNVGRFFQDTVFHTVFCFLLFIVPLLFAFAAGAVLYRPTLAHATALAGLLGLPWVYWTALKGSLLGNVWLMFNLSGKELGLYPPVYPALTIFSIALIVLAIAIAALRLIPSRWQFRKSPVCERTWPALAASFLFLVIWFSQSVMPYRIPGAVQRSQWPILQILHVEKHGLQFHESCVSVWEPPRQPLAVSFSENDRRLFQYRFQQNYASGQMPESLFERVRAMVHSSDRANEKRDDIKPLRAWNVEGWYFTAEGVGIKPIRRKRGRRHRKRLSTCFGILRKFLGPRRASRS